MRGLFLKCNLLKTKHLVKNIKILLLQICKYQKHYYLCIIK